MPTNTTTTTVSQQIHELKYSNKQYLNAFLKNKRISSDSEVQQDPDCLLVGAILKMN